MRQCRTFIKGSLSPDDESRIERYHSTDEQRRESREVIQSLRPAILARRDQIKRRTLAQRQQDNLCTPWSGQPAKSLSCKTGSFVSVGLMTYRRWVDLCLRHRAVFVRPRIFEDPCVSASTPCRLRHLMAWR